MRMTKMEKGLIKLNLIHKLNKYAIKKTEKGANCDNKSDLQDRIDDLKKLGKLI